MILPEANTSYYKLTVFQKSKELVLLIYKLTKTYLREEQFALVPQVRRAAVSILANIVEGYSKNSTKEYIRFLNIAVGSSTELKIYFELSLDLNYLSTENYARGQDLLIEVRKLLYTYQKSLRNRVKG